MVQAPMPGTYITSNMTIFTINDVSSNRLEDYLQPLNILETLPYFKTIAMQKDSEFTELFNRQILKMQVRSGVNQIENVVKYVWSMQSVNPAVQNVGPVGWC